MDHIENTILILLCAYSLPGERVYQATAQKRVLFICLPHSHCISMAVHTTVFITTSYCTKLAATLLLLLLHIFLIKLYYEEGILLRFIRKQKLRILISIQVQSCYIAKSWTSFYCRLSRDSSVCVCVCACVRVFTIGFSM
jgi:hypothetical protein